MFRVAALAAACLIVGPTPADPTSPAVSPVLAAAPSSPMPTPVPPAATTPPPVVASTIAPGVAPTATPAAPVLAPAPVATPAKPPAPKPVTLVARIDLTTQRMTVVVGGTTTHTWAISSGTREHATPAGTFRPSWMARMWHSRTYDLAPMPHSVFFNGGIAVHGTQWIGQLGRPASKGCIRLAPANAATFYNLVAKHSLAQTRVIVTGAPKFADPAVARARDGVPRMVGRSLPPGYLASQGSSSQTSGGLFDALFGPAPSAQVYAVPSRTRVR